MEVDLPIKMSGTNPKSSLEHLYFAEAKRSYLLLHLFRHLQGSVTLVLASVLNTSMKKTLSKLGEVSD